MLADKEKVRPLRWLAAAGLALALVSPATATAIPTTDRAGVEAAFLEDALTALETPVGWTGDVGTCSPGAPSAAAQAATLRMVNFVRGLAQLDPVSFDAALSGKAQKAALMMHANDDLRHDPPSTWRCWSADGAEAAASSNLALGGSAAEAIRLYMEDSDADNQAVGHRRWILRPSAATMGSGSTARANALWIFGADAPDATVPEWVPWPTPGYFPAPLEPLGRWSLGTSDPDVSLAGASVSVTDSTGVSLPVQTYPVEDAYADHTLVWEVSDVEVPRDPGEAVYSVSVTGIARADGGPTAFGYEVRLFAPPLTTTAPPRITGRARVGRYLTAYPGDWSPDPDLVRFQWFRSGTAVAGATGQNYLLRRRDRGDRMTVTVTALARGYADSSATSAPTRAVRPRA